jgi:flagellar biosynthesis protein FlhF
MGFKKYVATTARDAMNRIRLELGPDAIILSNRRSPENGKVEIIAAAPSQMEALVNEVTRDTTRRSAVRPEVATRSNAPVPASVEKEARVEPMSFQEFIRRQSRGLGTTTAASSNPVPAASSANLLMEERRRPVSPVEQAAPAVFRRRPSRVTEAERTVDQVAGTEKSVEAMDASVMKELQTMRSALSDRIAHLESRISHPGTTEPAQVSVELKKQIMTRLIMAGFSSLLSRQIVDQMPAKVTAVTVDAWLSATVADRLVCPGDLNNVLHMPGAVALVGPTGVGKTTTIAKLAARSVIRHGAASVGLITLDSYRMGAHDQLLSYGKILGVSVAVARDARELQAVLQTMVGKQRVFIDTCGLSQRDPRLADAQAILRDARFQGAPVAQVIVLNAGSQVETLDEVVRAWRADSTRGVVISKIDEAARIGSALDAVIRNQFPVLGVTNGQRVPEDWHTAQATVLAGLMMPTGHADHAATGYHAVPVVSRQVPATLAEPVRA